MKLAAIAKLIKTDEYCKLYKVFYNDGQGCDLYIGTKTAIFPLTDFPKAQNERELAALLGISEKEWNDIHFESDCPDDIRNIEGMNLDDTASGGRYYVIKDGMMVRGAVIPVKLEPLAKSGLYAIADMVKKTKDVADVEDLSEQEDKNDA